MKVLMLGWELPPHNSGGLGVACLELTRALASSGADIDFVLPYYSGQDFDHMRVTSVFKKPEDVQALPDAYGRPSKTVTKDGGAEQTAFEDVVSLMVETKEFDVIHAHDWLTFRAALRAKWESGKPLVAHIHSIERDRAGGQAGSPLVRDIEANTLLIADRVIAVSEHTKQAIIDDYGVPADKISVVYNSINPADFAPLNEASDYEYLSLMKSAGWKVMTYVGRLTIQKGLSQFISASAIALKHAPKTFLLIVGSGELRDEIIVQAADSGIADRLMLADFQRGKRLREAFELADLFVMPSVSEPFGLVALEAAGYGAPVLVSKQSGVAEVFNNCLKVDYWDINEMANKMAGVLCQPALGQELIRSANLELEGMSWSRPASQVMDIYHRHAQGVPA